MPRIRGWIGLAARIERKRESVIVENVPHGIWLRESSIFWAECKSSHRTVS
jgi:hypothetical protein